MKDALKIKVFGKNGQNNEQTKTFSQAIIQILNPLTKIAMFHCSIKKVYEKVRIHSVYFCVLNTGGVLKIGEVRVE